MNAANLNTIGENSVSELIYLFLDGEADGVQQQTLFSALATNPELQSEFQQALEINAGFAADKETLYPSADLTNSVFTAAGFAPQTAATVSSVDTAAVSTGKTWGIASFFQKHILNMLAVTGASIITAALMQFVVSPAINDGKIDDLKAKIEQKYEDEKRANDKIWNEKIESLNNQLNTLIPKSKSFALADEVIPKLNRSQNYSSESKQNSTLKTSKDINITENLDANHFDLPNAPVQSINPKSGSSKTQINTAVTTNNINVIGDCGIIASPLARYNPEIGRVSGGVFEPYNPFPEFSNSSNISFELDLGAITGLTMFPTRQSTVSGDITNFHASLRTHFDENNSIAIYIGKENINMFALTWNGTEPVFSRVDNILWGGAGYRFTMSPLEEMLSLSPFGEVIVGGSMFGFLSKGIVGLQYNPQNTLVVSVGLEGYLQTYTMMSALKATGKLGVVTSLGIRF